jgi:hypothetical protein
MVTVFDLEAGRLRAGPACRCQNQIVLMRARYYRMAAATSLMLSAQLLHCKSMRSIAESETSRFPDLTSASSEGVLLLAMTILPMRDRQRLPR